MDNAVFLSSFPSKLLISDSQPANIHTCEVVLTPSCFIMWRLPSVPPPVDGCNAAVVDATLLIAELFFCGPHQLHW